MNRLRRRSKNSEDKMRIQRFAGDARGRSRAVATRDQVLTLAPPPDTPAAPKAWAQRRHMWPRYF